MPRRRRLPAYPTNPLAPLPEPLLQRQVRGDVRANTLPLIHQITGEINRRARAGGQNISGIASELARNLGGFAGQAQDIYHKADESLGGIDTAIADRLAASGQSGAAGLRHQADLSGVPSALVESLAGGAAGAGAGAGAASFAHGGAERAALVSRGAGAQEYAAKLPGLARLSGLQGVRELQAGAGRDLTTQLDRIRSQTPSLVASSLRDARNREITKALGNLGYQGGIQRATIAGTASVTGANTRAAATNTATKTRAEIAAANRAAQNARDAANRRERARHNRATETAKKKKNKFSYGSP